MRFSDIGDRLKLSLFSARFSSPATHSDCPLETNTQSLARVAIPKSDDLSFLSCSSSSIGQSRAVLGRN